MIGPLGTRYRRFRGLKEAALTVPALDGPYKPNHALDHASVVCSADDPDNLVVLPDGVQFSSGARRWRSVGGEPELMEEHRAAVTAMAASPDGRLAVAEEGGAIVFREPAGGTADLALPLRADITAMSFAGERTLLVCVGSSVNASAAWTRDLLERGASGSVWSIDLETRKATCLADGLSYPAGVMTDGQGRIVVAESWKSRLIVLGGAAPRQLIGDLPGYPARIVPAGAGGAWLAVMAPRNQLLEFVLREDGYRRRMLAEVPPDQWVAPALRAPTSFLQPLQQGAQRTLGQLKSWAPGFSIGLVIRFDAGWRAAHSLYSRADGVRHGITSVVEHGGALLMSSIGGGVILSLVADEEVL